MKHFHIILTVLLMIILFTSCKKKEEDKRANLSLNFTFSVDNQKLQTDTLAYENCSGNKFEVNEIKFFISDIVLRTSDNQLVTIDKKYSIHYIDNTISSTMKWKIDQQLPAVSYQSISFRLGLSDAQNVTHYFLNAPESNMAWPDALGGGYHYMMINGKWLSNNILKPFNFHLGRGQIYDGDNITGYIDNSFVVTIPHSGFSLSENGTSLTLDMNVNQWFNAVEPFDFEYFGGSIMTNQEAQEVARKNGVKAFSIK